MAWLVKIIFCPLGDQSGSSSIAAWLFVMFFGRARFLRKSSTFKTKISLSVVAAPGKRLIGRPVPDAEAWNAIFLPSGDHVAELPRTSDVCPVPSAFITNKSDVLSGSPSARSRLLSNTILLPSGDKAGKPSEEVFSV